MNASPPMISALGLEEAQSLFQQLPPALRLATLSPVYVAADATRDSALEPVFLCYREENSFWLHSTHRGRVLDTSWHDLQSAYGYGGPVASSDDPAFTARAWSQYREWCRSSGILAEFVRLHPMAGNERFYCGTILDDRMTVAIPLLGTDPEAAFSTRTRRGIGQAARAGVVAEWHAAEEIRNLFPDFYLRAMEALSADPFFLFPAAYFEALSKLPAVRLMVCRKGGEILSMGIFFWGAEIIEYHLGATSTRGKESYSSHLMFKAAADKGRLDGMRWLYMGGGTNGDADNSLLYFKAGFSDSRFPFRIGYQIIDPVAYDNLRKSLMASGRANLKRILFYS